MMATPANKRDTTPSKSSLTNQLNGTSLTSNHFERLPIEIRRQIYSSLLTADKVRQPPDKLLVCSYHFDVAILCVNRKIYQEASDMLYNDNRFVVVSCDWEMIFTIMSNHEVATVCKDQKLVARFKRNIMRLHIKFLWAIHNPNNTEFTNKQSGKVLKSFIIMANDLPIFTRMLHIMNMTNGGDRQNTKYNFRIEATPARLPGLELQRTLLEPFRQLYTREGKRSSSDVYFTTVLVS